MRKEESASVDKMPAGREGETPSPRAGKPNGPLTGMPATRENL